jgi:hypothetical protein
MAKPPTRSEVAAKKRLPGDAELAERIVRVIHAMTAGQRERGPRGCVQWAVAAEIRKALEIDEVAFKRALAFAVSAELVSVEPGKLYSICLTRDGWDLARSQ